MSDRRSSVAALFHIVGWVIVVPLAAVALARVVAWDSRSVLVGLNALTPLLFLPAWPVAIAAALRRVWPLLVTAAAVILGHVAFVLPEILAAEGLPDGVGASPTFRIFNANVYAYNQNARGYVEEIRRSQADIVVLQEATPAFVGALDAGGVLAELPHRLTVARSDPFAAMVASRWPLTEDDVVAARGRPILVRATFDFRGTPVRLFAFHAVSPVAGNRQAWMDDLRTLRTAVAAERRPVLVAGDFNATWNHRSFRRLLDVGLVDAAAARGRPFQMTWPRNRRILPPVIRIDHVLTTDGLAVTRIERGDGPGSDHRTLVADVAVVSPGAAP